MDGRRPNTWCWLRRAEKVAGGPFESTVVGLVRAVLDDGCVRDSSSSRFKVAVD